MASNIERAISAVLAYAADDSHGYVLHSRNYDNGTDCAGLVRLYASYIENVDVSEYPNFGTWNEKETLLNRGWTYQLFNYANAQRGDVFVRAIGDSTGHTVIYLGGGRIVGAEADKDGAAGDSSGREVCEKDYYDYSYNQLLRPPASGSSDVDSLEYHVSSGFAGTYRCTVDGLNVRSSPTTADDSNIVAQYNTGETVILDGGYYVNEGWCWGTYISYSGKRRYIATGRYTGKSEDDDYLVKV